MVSGHLGLVRKLRLPARGVPCWRKFEMSLAVQSKNDTGRLRWSHSVAARCRYPRVIVAPLSAGCLPDCLAAAGGVDRPLEEKRGRADGPSAARCGRMSSTTTTLPRAQCDQRGIPFQPTRPIETKAIANNEIVPGSGTAAGPGTSRLLKKDRSGEFRVADRGQELAGTVSTGSVRYRKAALWRGQVRGSRSRRGLREQFGQPDEIIGGHSEGELPIDLG